MPCGHSYHLASHSLRVPSHACASPLPTRVFLRHILELLPLFFLSSPLSFPSPPSALNDRANLHLFRSQADHSPSLASWQESNYYLRTDAKSAMSSASSAFEPRKKVAKGNPFTYNPNWPWGETKLVLCD